MFQMPGLEGPPPTSLIVPPWHSAGVLCWPEAHSAGALWGLGKLCVATLALRRHHRGFWLLKMVTSGFGSKNNGCGCAGCGFYQVTASLQTLPHMLAMRTKREKPLLWFPWRKWHMTKNISTCRRLNILGEETGPCSFSLLCRGNDLYGRLFQHVNQEVRSRHRFITKARPRSNMKYELFLFVLDWNPSLSTISCAYSDLLISMEFTLR